MKLRFALRRCLVTLALVMGLLFPAQAQKLSFTLVEQFVIGDDKQAPVEYLFSTPEFVRTDSKGKIYVHDRRSADVRVFDTSGRYFTKIGRRGAGPGEMREIIGMHVDDQDRLIVVDRISKRYTIFTDLGKSFETKAITEWLASYPDIVLTLSDSFVFRYVKRLSDPKGGSGIDDDKVLHLLDSELDQRESFAQLGDIVDLDREFLRARSGNRGAMKVATNKSDAIVLAPEVYGGYIYRYTRSNGTWAMEKLKGGPAPRQFFKPFSYRDFETNPDVRKSAIIVSNPDGIFGAQVLNWSLGIVILSTGDIVNFTKQKLLGKDAEYQAELFDRNGSLMGYGPLQFEDPDLDGNGRVMSSIRILWHDANDRIYLRRLNEEGAYVLSVAELVINPL